jgi:hypothetical protein
MQPWLKVNNNKGPFTCFRVLLDIPRKDLTKYFAKRKLFRTEVVHKYEYIRIDIFQLDIQKFSVNYLYSEFSSSLNLIPAGRVEQNTQ